MAKWLIENVTFIQKGKTHKSLPNYVCVCALDKTNTCALVNSRIDKIGKKLQGTVCTVCLV